MPRKKKISTEDQKQLLLLKANYEMHLKTREEVVLRGKQETIERIDLMLNDILAQMKKIDPSFTQACIDEFANKDEKTSVDQILDTDYDSQTIYETLTKIDYENGFNDEEANVATENEADEEEDIDLYKMADSIDDDDSQEDTLEEINNESKEESIYSSIDANAQYDVIKLPSKGECYKNKIDRLSVGYLTAADENLITSPNLYESGTIIDVLLKKKVLSKGINVDELVAGDVDAIMVFLRGTSYGNMFPITATEPTTKKQISTQIDLSKLSYKPFNLKGDENGHFDFVLPRTKKTVKFKFLTKRDEKLLQKLNKKENSGITAFELHDGLLKIKNALKSDKVLSDADKADIINASKKIEKWSELLNKKDDKVIPYTKAITNTMEMQIVSVDGNTDRKFIHEFVLNMPASDSLAFRRYIYDNQPGVNFEVDVQRPESMGGGSFKCFLEWDDTIFWNIA